MMYLDHFGLAQPPFKITPHTEFFFSGANRGATLDALIYAIRTGDGLVKVTGEVGAGKTMLSRVLVERLPASVETIYLAIPSLTRDEILQAIAADLKLKTKTLNTAGVLERIQQHLIKLHSQGRQVVVLIDEAHAMPLETLEELRLLSNLETNRDKLLQIVLFGQPELDQNLAKPHMRQVKERITHSFFLQPMPRKDIGEYLNFRLRAAGYRGPDLFTARCIAMITGVSQGLTRRVNILADKTLLAAYADGVYTLEPRHVTAAIEDSDFGRPRWWSTALGWVLGSSVAIVVVVGAIWATSHLGGDNPKTEAAAQAAR